MNEETEKRIKGRVEGITYLVNYLVILNNEANVRHKLSHVQVHFPNKIPLDLV